MDENRPARAVRLTSHRIKVPVALACEPFSHYFFPISLGRPPITTRWTILDDSDERTQYAGPWLDVDGTPFDSIGNFGPTYGGRMRATAAAEAAVSLKFNGTDVFLRGTVAPRGEPGIPQRVRWECLIDGEPHLGSGTLGNNAGDTSLNNFAICEADRLSPGEHTLGLNVTSNEDQFYVDRLGYGTANGTLLSGERVIQVDYTDSQIQYTGSSWATFTMPRLPSSTYTDQPDSSVSFSFNGSSIAWYAAVENGALNASRGNYQLDNEAPVPFDIPGNFSTPQFFLKYFETPEREVRRYRLTVRYTGIPGAMPLALSHFEVTDSRVLVRTSTLPIMTSTSSPSSTASPTQTAPSSLLDEKRSLVGPIVGGVVGGFGLICILGFIWYFLRRRRQKALQLKNPFRSTLLLDQVKGRRDSSNLCTRHHQIDDR